MYLDDIICYSQTFDDHLNSLDALFNRLFEARKLSPEKCVLFQKQVGFIGHVISESGVATDPKKIEVVKRFLSNTFFFCSYYRKFVQGFSTIAKPLHKLTEKGANFRWTEECETSFMRLKNVLTDSPILAYLKSEGLFVLDTDASAFSVGAVLSKSRRTKSYLLYSQCLSKTERQYCVTRRELLAVISAVKHYHHYTTTSK